MKESAAENMQRSFDFEAEVPKEAALEIIKDAVCFDETTKGVSTQDLIAGKDGRFRNANEDVFEFDSVHGVYKIVEKAAPLPLRNEMAALKERHPEWPEEYIRIIAKEKFVPKKLIRKGDDYRNEDPLYH